jgi:HlyD family secretion protein
MRKIFNPAVIVGISIIIAAGILTYGFVIYKKPVLQNTVQAKNMNITEDVSANGTVVAATTVSLSFQRGGQVTSLIGDVGTPVSKGQTIATVSSGSLQAQLSVAEAALESEQIKLTNLQTPNSDASSSIQVSIENARQSVIVGLSEGAISLDSTLAANVDPLFANPRTNPNFGTTITQNGTTYSITAPSYDLETKINSERVALNSDMTTLTNLISQASASQSDADISAAETEAETTLGATEVMLADINTALSSYVAIDSTSQAIYTGYKQGIAVAIGTINTALSAIRTSLLTIASSQTSVSNYDISLEESNVTSAEAQVQSIQEQISEGVLTSPINGVITEEDIKLGEDAGANTPVITVMSNGKFQIDAYVSEADVNSLKVGGLANITLVSNSGDAVAASTTPYQATIISIDPAETMTNGIGSYKVTLQFANEDSSIKSGMTANVDFIVANETNVLAIPESALITKDNQTYVIVPGANGQTSTEPVTVGIRGNGYIQILSGLSAGDSVVDFGNSSDTINQ